MELGAAWLYRVKSLSWRPRILKSIKYFYGSTVFSHAVQRAEQVLPPGETYWPSGGGVGFRQGTAPPHFHLFIYRQDPCSTHPFPEHSLGPCLGQGAAFCTNVHEELVFSNDQAHRYPGQALGVGDMHHSKGRGVGPGGQSQARVHFWEVVLPVHICCLPQMAVTERIVPLGSRPH